MYPNSNIVCIQLGDEFCVPVECLYVNDQPNGQYDVAEIVPDAESFVDADNRRQFDSASKPYGKDNHFFTTEQRLSGLRVENLKDLKKTLDYKMFYAQLNYDGKCDWLFYFVKLYYTQLTAELFQPHLKKFGISQGLESILQFETLDFSKYQLSQKLNSPPFYSGKNFSTKIQSQKYGKKTF